MKYICVILFLAASLCYAHHAAIVCDDGRTIVIEGEAQPDSWDKCGTTNVEPEPQEAQESEPETSEDTSEDDSEEDNEDYSTPVNPCLSVDKTKYSIELEDGIITLTYKYKYTQVRFYVGDTVVFRMQAREEIDVKDLPDYLCIENLKFALYVNNCQVAIYPEVVPKAPSLQKSKLAITWASIKKN